MFSRIWERAKFRAQHNHSYLDFNSGAASLFPGIRLLEARLKSSALRLISSQSPQICLHFLDVAFPIECRCVSRLEAMALKRSAVRFRRSPPLRRSRFDFRQNGSSSSAGPLRGRFSPLRTHEAGAQPAQPARRPQPQLPPPAFWGAPPSPGCSAGPGTPGAGGSRRHNRRAERGPQPNGRGLVTSSPYPASLVSKYPAIAALASSTLMPEVSISIFGP